jgi:integrase
MRKTNQLTALQVSKMKKVGWHCDGGGLYLQVSPTLTKSWIFRYMINGKTKLVGLGPLDTVNLAEARMRAREKRQLLLDGKDPLEMKREARAAAKALLMHTMTFAQCADAYLRQHSSTWKNDKHRKQWGTSLETAKAEFGASDVRKIDTTMIVRLLDPIWEATPETGSRLRGRIEKVLDWAAARGYRDGANPARWKGHMQHLLNARPKSEHHAAMPFADLPAFMARLRDRDSISARALELLILTACRTSETIKATWSEIDLKAKTWIIPASRMKAGKDHTVPLSDRAVELLKALPRMGDHIFPGAKEGKPLSNMAMLELVRGMDCNGYRVHGFRSTFRDWCGERTNFDRETIEHALAHKLPDKVEAAYRRGTSLEKRVRLMEAWSTYCMSDGAAGAGKVVSLRA